jgi:hypothetical protein
VPYKTASTLGLSLQIPVTPKSELPGEIYVANGTGGDVAKSKPISTTKYLSTV